MTYRDRRQAKADRLRGYAANREARQHGLNEAARADEAATGIPFGQPILVGHHSQRRHERAIERIDRNMRTAVDNADKAGAMRSRADEIERQAEHAIYDDDPDAVERLQAKLAGLEAQRERMKRENADWLKANREAAKAMTPFERDRARPHPQYALTNLGGVISNTRKRIQILSQPERPRVMTARRAGECRNCNAPIEPGQTIKWFRRAAEAEHQTCPPQPDEAAA